MGVNSTYALPSAAGKPPLTAQAGAGNMPRAKATSTHAIPANHSPESTQTAQATLRSQAGEPSREGSQRKIPDDRKAIGMARKPWSRCAAR